VRRKSIHHKSEMINFAYTLGFMDYAAFVVIVAIYFILTIYLNTRVNSNANKNQLGSNSEWNVKQKDENFFSGELCLQFFDTSRKQTRRLNNFFCNCTIKHHKIFILDDFIGNLQRCL